MSVAGRTLTLADVALPRAGALQNLLLIVGASLLTAAAAQLAIRLPWTPVPITGQTFAVLLAGAVLGRAARVPRAGALPGRGRVRPAVLRRWRRRAAARSRARAAAT